MAAASRPRPAGPDTIVARATPPAPSGLAVVRLSGPEALAVARRVFRPAGGGDLAPRRATLGTVRDPERDETVDQVVAVAFPGPRSYTGEDSVEFTCHGGLLPARLVTAACLAAGARPAAPGEFTRRAFLNGRLSLDQAEAVADLIHAETRLAARGALAQLQGALRAKLEELAAPLRALAAELTGALEFDETDAVTVDRGQVACTLDAARETTERLLAAAEAGRRLRDGVQVVVVGPPNVGKSSLFNALLEEPRALVDAAPGTTRDSIEARLVHRDCLFVLHDTAGLRAGGERVERLGMERTRQLLAAADLALVLVDLSGDAGDSGAAWDGLPPDLPRLVVGTKADRLDGAPPKRWRGAPLLATSARTGQGLDALRAALLDAADAEGLRRTADMGILLNDRHTARLREARKHLAELAALAAAGAPDEVLATLLAAVLARLDELTGRVWTERLLDDVFRRFCVGK